MNYYLIDYENTGETGLNGIDKLDENSLVVIFYSVNNGRISFEMHQKLMEAKARIKYVKVALGAKNALDFQLSSYLGYLISQNQGDTFCIISRDNGYNAVIRFWEGYGIKQQYSIIRSLPAALPAPEEPQREQVESVAVENIVAEAEIVPEEKPKQPKPRQRNTAGRKTLVKVRERNDNPEMRRLEEKVRAYIEDAEIRAEVAPLIFVGLRDNPCSFAIFMLTGVKSDKNLEQQKGCPQTPTPPINLLSSLTPIWRSSILVLNTPASSFTSSRKSILVSAVK